MKRLLYLFLLAAAGALVVRTYVMEGIYIASDSMKPTLKTNDHLFVNTMIFLFREPARGEIVVVKSPDNKRFVKRIIAIGGDVLEIKDKDVYLNMTKLEEPYVIHTRKDERLVDDNYGPVTVPEGHFFVMGDNRDSSDDSRNWASPFLARKDITGKVLK